MVGPPVNECVTKSGRHVRTDTGTETGTVPVRLWLRQNLPQEEFDTLMRKYGMIEGKYHEWSANAGDTVYYKRGMVLQGLMAVDGTTVLLPAEFVRVPLSDRGSCGQSQRRLATLGGEKTTLTPITLSWSK